MKHRNELLNSEKLKALEEGFVGLLAEKTKGIDSVSPPIGGYRSEAEVQFKKVKDSRGRGLYYPFLSSGIGNGPYVECVDGSVKLDFITGIGVHFFGHNHPEINRALFQASLKDTVMQGNLMADPSYSELLSKLLSFKGKSSLEFGWYACSGSMANENALKIIRFQKHPATKVVAFESCFAGRSTAMQEITDKPQNRVNQPTYDEVIHIPFYDEASAKKSTEDILEKIEKIHEEQGNEIAAFHLEIVQGEAGFRSAPSEFFKAVLSSVRQKGWAVWVDEVQSFGRTGELFAFRRWGLDEYVDVVTVGKMLQTAVTLFSKEFNPDPGLVSGTFASSSASIGAGLKILELLDSGDFLGESGKIRKLEAQFQRRIEALKAKGYSDLISDFRIYGGMLSAVFLDGTLDKTRQFLNGLYKNGLICFIAGEKPYRLRCLPPLGVIENKHIDEAFDIIERTLDDFR